MRDETPLPPDISSKTHNTEGENDVCVGQDVVCARKERELAKKEERDLAKSNAKRHSSDDTRADAATDHQCEKDKDELGRPPAWIPSQTRDLVNIPPVAASEANVEILPCCSDTYTELRETSYHS